VNVGSVLDLDRIVVIINQPPELALDVIFGENVFLLVEWAVLSWQVGEVSLLEFIRFAKEAGQ
jgi:hypothetical protein